MDEEDGGFDYRGMSTAELEYAVLHIDGRRFPKNLANARAALATRQPIGSPVASLSLPDAAPDIKRPRSVSAVAWLLIGLCVVNLLAVLMGYRPPLARDVFARSSSSETVQVESEVIDRLLTLVLATCMLRGANWARWIYLALVSIGVVISAVSSNSFFLVIPAAIRTFVIGYFLTRADANAFFRARSLRSDLGAGLG